MSLPYPTSAHLLKLDATAAARATALIAAVQAGYDTSRIYNPSLPPETITAGDVCTVAVQNRLNFWKPIASWMPWSPAPPDQPTIATFTPHAGTGVSNNGILVWDQSLTIANAIIAALGGVPALADVLGCACCTGLASMSSIWAVEGPFLP